MTKLEKLPRLIERAIAALEKATTSAEVLEAREHAGIAYTAAKEAARLSKIKDAHATVLAACRKTMGDALVIEARAQCRLADEYDAAQERGEVAKQGEIGRGRSSQREHLSTSADTGISRKQVHAARKVRDAEKAKPGIVRETVEERLLENEEPTRADVKRAISGKSKNKPKAKGGGRRRESKRETEGLEAKLLAALLSGKSSTEVAAEYNVGDRSTRRLLEEFRLAPIDAATLPISAQQKLDIALRQQRRKQDIEFEQRVLDEIKKRLDTLILPNWKEQIAEAQKLYAKRKGLMDKATFNAIRRGLHPDSRHAISDRVLGEAFNTFMGLEKYLLNEADSPTEWPDIPSSAAEWDKMRTKPRRPNGPTAIRPR